MSKFDSLVKRAEQFEKLAIYGDRKTFLEAIAGKVVTLSGPMKAEVGAVTNGPLGWGENTQAVINKLTDLMSAPNVNTDDLANALQEAASKLPKSAPQSHMQAVQDLIAKVQQLGTPENMVTWHDLRSKEDATPTTTPTPAKSNYPAIAKETQDQLNQILLPYGKIAVPLQLDGSLGQKTQAALNAFKQTYNLPATPENIKKIYFQVVKHIEPKAPF